MHPDVFVIQIAYPVFNVVVRRHRARVRIKSGDDQRPVIRVNQCQPCFSLKRGIMRYAETIHPMSRKSQVVCRIIDFPNGVDRCIHRQPVALLCEGEFLRVGLQLGDLLCQRFFRSGQLLVHGSQFFVGRLQFFIILLQVCQELPALGDIAQDSNDIAFGRNLNPVQADFGKEQRAILFTMLPFKRLRLSCSGCRQQALHFDGGGSAVRLQWR